MPRQLVSVGQGLAQRRPQLQPQIFAGAIIEKQGVAPAEEL